MPLTTTELTSAVSVVIVNYNAGEWLLQSVALALTQSQQIIVVDNASMDDSLNLLEARYVDDQRVIIVRSDKNIGFAAGCNRGAQMATAPMILFLNPDCLLKAHSVARLLEVIRQNPNIGMVGGLLIDENGVEQRGCRREIPTLRRVLSQLFGLSRIGKDFNLHKQPLPSGPTEIEAISGAMMLIRREVLEDIGGWDETYFLHCEDLDLCMKLHQKDWKIFFVPDAVAVHIQGVCSRSRPIFVSWHKHKGMLRFHRKFYKNRYSLWLMWTITAGIWCRFGLVAIRHLLFHRMNQFFSARHAE